MTEADAEQLDMKAEDIVRKFLAEKRRTETSMIDGDDLEGSETEWKGKLMILNQSDRIRRPTQTVYNKLHQLNETYQLGHLLRKCRSPDFFSEVTALQVYLAMRLLFGLKDLYFISINSVIHNSGTQCCR